MSTLELIGVSRATVYPGESIDVTVKWTVEPSDLILNTNNDVMFAFSASLVDDAGTICKLSTSSKSLSVPLHTDEPHIYPANHTPVDSQYKVAYDNLATVLSPLHVLDLAVHGPIVMTLKCDIADTTASGRIVVTLSQLRGLSVVDSYVPTVAPEVFDTIKILPKPNTVYPPSFPSRPLPVSFQSQPVAGELTVLRGINFGADVGTVSFGGAVVPQLDIVLWNDNQITFRVPRAIFGDAQILTVNRPDIDLTSFPLGFTVSPVATPIITGIDWPNNQAKAGVSNVITIFGSNFQAQAGQVQLLGQSDMTAIAPQIIMWTPNKIQATVSSKAKSGKLKIKTYEDKFSNEINIFLGSIVPSITKIVPSSFNEGDMVAIIGTGFTETTGKVLLGESLLSVDVVTWNDTCVVVSIGYGMPSGNMLIETYEKKRSNAKPVVIKASDIKTLPRIIRVSPAGAPQGSIIKIVGTGFGDYVPQLSFVLLGNTNLELAQGGWSDTEITARVHISSKTDYMRVITSNGESNEALFIVTDAPLPEDVVIQPKPSTNVVVPEILAVQPQYMAPADSVILISGKNFGRQEGKVFLGTQELEVVPNSWAMGEVQVQLPANPTRDIITIKSVVGVSNKVTYTVLEPAPLITAVSPATGEIPYVLTITGEHFGTIAPDGTSKFVRTAAGKAIPLSNIVSWTATEIQVGLTADLDLTARRVQVIRDNYKSNWFTVGATYPADSSVSAAVSSGDIMNENGQLSLAQNPSAPIITNIPSGSPVIPNLNAEKWDNMSWEDVTDYVDDKLNGKYAVTDRLQTINNVSPDVTGNIKLCAAGSIEIVPNPLKNEIIIASNDSEVPTDPTTGSITIDAGSIHEVQASDGLVAVRNGDKVTLSLDYGMGLNQVAPSEHTHSDMKITIVYE